MYRLTCMSAITACTACSGCTASTVCTTCIASTACTVGTILTAHTACTACVLVLLIFLLACQYARPPTHIPACPLLPARMHAHARPLSVARPSLRSPACLSVYRLTQVPLIPSLSRSHFPLSHNPISLSPLSLSTQQIHTMCSTLSMMCSTWKSHSHIMCKQKLANGTCPHPARLPARPQTRTHKRTVAHTQSHTQREHAGIHAPAHPPARLPDRTHACRCGCERTVGGGGNGEHTYARAGTLPYGMHMHA